MNKNKILKLVVASSAIVGGIGLSSNTVHATENNANNMKTGELTQSSMALKSVTKGKVVNISTNLRVRSDAGTNYDTIGYLYNGQEIEVNSEKGDWYRISFNGREGYVSKDYIKLNETASNTVLTTGKKGQVINITSSLNIRQSASTGSAVIGSLRNGDTFEVISNSNGWCNIKSQNVVGFVKGEYVKEIDSSNVESKTETKVETKTTIKGKVVNVTSNLRVRTSPSSTSSILGYKLNGEEVGILGESGDWYKVSFNNADGYVAKEYIQKENVTPVNTSTEIQKTETISGKGQVKNVTSSLNIRQSASTSSAVLGTLRNGEALDIIGKSGNWYNIKTGSVTGYVSADYVKEVSGNTSTNNNAEQQVIGKKGQVINITSNLRVRSQASASATVLGYLLNGQVVDVTEKSGQWIKINFNGQVGYVSSEYIKFVDASTSTSNTNTTVTFNSVFNVIKSQLGSPYVWGGSGENLTTTTLNALKRAFPGKAAAGLYNRAASYVNQGYKAFDCSGLMQWGYKQAGISIGRTTWDQIGNGTEVSISALKPGDLLFYSSLEHVGMYIGNGQWIEAPNSSSNVRIVNVPWSKIGRARRILS
jgi:probable enterotoxin B